MLTIKCAGCKRKIWKYLKIGKGQVLRCHKSKITKEYDFERREERIYCRCGRAICEDKGKYFRMIPKAFMHTGEKN